MGTLGCEAVKGPWEREAGRQPLEKAYSSKREGWLGVDSLGKGDFTIGDVCLEEINSGLEDTQLALVKFIN